MSTGLAQELSAAAAPAMKESSAIGELRTFLRRLEARMDSMDSPIPFAAAAEPSDPTTAAAPPPAASSASSDPTETYVLNRDTSTVHRSLVPPSDPPHLQKTVCGWPFATRKYTRMADIPTGTPYKHICPRCCSFERELAMQSQGEVMSEID